MSIIFITVCVLLSFGAVDARPNSHYDDEPTPDELFGVLGIFPSFCESVIGSMTRRCRTPAPVAMSGMMGMEGGKGKGGRRMVVVEDRDTEMYDDITEAFNELSSFDKKRLLIAMEQDDVTLVDAIFEGAHSSDRTLQQRGSLGNEPTPDELFGVLGIFPSFCESVIGSMTRRCRTPAPVAMSGMMGMEGGKGKGGRRMVVVEDRDTEMYDDITEAFNELSSFDKKRLLIAMEQDDVTLVDEIFEGAHSSDRTLQQRGSLGNEPTPDELFGVLGIFPSFCESVIGSMTRRCRTPAPVAMSGMMGMEGGKGKGGRRMVVVEDRDNESHEYITDAYNALSSKDKKRLLDAIQQNDVKMVDEIFDGDHP